MQVVEVVPVAPEWAFARTSSAGKQTIHAIKKTTDEANQVSDRICFTEQESSLHLRLCDRPAMI